MRKSIFLILLISLSFKLFGQTIKIKAIRVYKKVNSSVEHTGELLLITENQFDSTGRDICETNYTDLTMHQYSDTIEFLTQHRTIYETNNQNYTDIYLRKIYPIDSSITKTRIIFNSKKLPIKEIRIRSSSKDTSVSSKFYYYNRKDSLIKIEFHSDSKLTNTIEYKYDRRGVKKSSKGASIYNNTALLHRDNFKSRSKKTINGRVIIETWNQKHYWTINKHKVTRYFDKDNKEKKTIHQSDNQSSISYLEYEANGKLSKISTTTKHWNEPRHDLYEYTPEGKLSTVKSYDSDNKVISTKSYLYNNYGDIKEYYYKGVLKTKYEYDYWK